MLEPLDLSFSAQRMAAACASSLRAASGPVTRMTQMSKPTILQVARSSAIVTCHRMVSSGSMSTLSNRCTTQMRSSVANSGDAETVGLLDDGVDGVGTEEQGAVEAIGVTGSAVSGEEGVGGEEDSGEVEHSAGGASVVVVSAAASSSGEVDVDVAAGARTSSSPTKMRIKWRPASCFRSPSSAYSSRSIERMSGCKTAMLVALSTGSSLVLQMGSRN